MGYPQNPNEATLFLTMKHYDVAILGGGISGLGVASACVERGYSTLILEARSVASATSNNTLRIIHGGFRYLQTAHVARVIRSLNDQTFVAENFNDAVAPLACLMPLARSGLKSKLPVTAAAMLYGAIMRACRSPLPPPRIASAREVQEIAPILAPLAPYGALCWHDLVMTDPRLVHSKLLTSLTTRGCEIREHEKALSISPMPSGYDVLTESGQQITARRVVNTLGPWIASVNLPQHLRGVRPSWCLGFNLILNKQLHSPHALGIQSPDGRLFFCVPRGERTTIGTWYIPHNELTFGSSVSQMHVRQEEICACIASFNQALPGAEISLADVDSLDVGVLPMSALRARGPELYGSELIHHTRGYCEVVSTKYTTFRSLGERVAGLIA